MIVHSHIIYCKDKVSCWGNHLFVHKLKISGHLPVEVLADGEEYCFMWVPCLTQWRN